MTPNPVIDDLAIHRAKRGDRAAWSEIYEGMGDRLMGFLVVRLGNREDAAEALSETFTRAISRVGGLRTTTFEVFRAWIYQIARNVAVDHLRRRGREMPTADIPEGVAADDPLATVVDGESRAEVRSAFGDLPRADQEVLYLRVVAGLDSESVAAIVGTTPGAVRMRQMRALGTLETRLGS